jgi:GNAT superfamily N-acetyltransferase
MPSASAVNLHRHISVRLMLDAPWATGESMIYVDRTLHGRGIAHTLMRAALSAASPRSLTIWLGVWERNTRAIAFYTKWGFVDVGHQLFVLGSDRQTESCGGGTFGPRSPSWSEPVMGLLIVV